MGAEYSNPVQVIDGNPSLDNNAVSGTIFGTSGIPRTAVRTVVDIEKELRETIQFLAIQNMYLCNGKREAENKLSEIHLDTQYRCETVIRNYGVKHNVQLLVSGKPVDIETILGLGEQAKIFENCQNSISTPTELSSTTLKPSACHPMRDEVALNRAAEPASAACTSSINEENVPVVLAAAASSRIIPNEANAVNAGCTLGEQAAGDAERETRNKLEMEHFKEDLKNRREERHKAISAISLEMERLRGELQDEKLAKELVEKELDSVRDRLADNGNNSGQQLLLQEIDRLKSELSSADSKNCEMLTESKHLKDEVESLSNLLKEETLKNEQDTEFARGRIDALKDVAALSKQMLTIRESQVSDLKERLRLIHAVPNENSTTQMQTEIACQLKEITSLKSMHEEQLQKMDKEKENVRKLLEEKTEESSEYERKYTDLSKQFDKLSITASESEELNKSLQTRLELSVDESKGLSKEISLINSIFTQMLVGNSCSTALDLDKLTRLLQENHDLITEMTMKEDSSETAASLPKLLLDLVNQIDSGENTEVVASTSGTHEMRPEDTASEHNVNIGNKMLTVAKIPEKNKVIQEDGTNTILAVEEIASNLPKVWRVLMELLSHHITPTPTDNSKLSCYKCIDTPSGPKLVPSVSNTYIRLKDLILEKKSLQKDLGKLKQLNGHLESKLHEQETRLSLVSAELQKTWGVVGRLRSQFRQLRTHEQILRYELQQKRNLLTELKTELEYCREKWERARQKDLETAEECQKLRKEFAARKLQDQNNSSESGFSEGKENESGDEEKSASKQVPSRISAENSKAQPEKKESSKTHDSVQMKSEMKMEAESKENSSSSTEEPANDPSRIPVSQQQLTPYPCTKTIWMSLLKLHVMFSPQNRKSQLDHNHSNDTKALDSIFSLQPITIPEPILKQLNDQTNIPSDEGNEGQSIKDLPVPKCDIEPYASGPSTSSSSRKVPDGQTRDALGRTSEEALAARAARLKRLEEQTQMLFKKVTRTTHRSVALCTRLEELHEQYGVPNPPPLPQVLPVLRIPVSGTRLPAQRDSVRDSTPVPDRTDPPATTNDSTKHENDNED